MISSENFVSLRYTATGSHIGAPHNGIEATNRKAEWTAAGNFVIDEKSGLIQHWWKDWDKMRSMFRVLGYKYKLIDRDALLLSVWKQLGWVKPDNDKAEFA